MCMYKCTHDRNRMVKETNETINFQACFFYTPFEVLNKSIHHYNFSLSASFSG